MLKKFIKVFVFLSLFDLVYSVPNRFQYLILNELGLDKVPNSLIDHQTVNERTSCINFFKNLNLVDQKYDEIKCFPVLSKTGHQIFVFPFEYTLSNVFTIRIFRNLSIIDQNDVMNHEIYLRISTTFENYTSFITQEVTNENGWFEIDVSELVSSNNKEEISFEIECFIDQNELSLNQLGFIVDQSDYRPFILSFSKVNHMKRSKRQEDFDEDKDLSLFSNSDFDDDRYCEAMPIYYKFEDFGWDDFIISPKGFTSIFCKGRCSFPLKSDANLSNHALIQSLMQLMYPDKYPEPCCVADKTESLQIVYFDPDYVPRFKVLDNIIIKSCRCA